MDSLHFTSRLINAASVSLTVQTMEKKNEHYHQREHGEQSRTFNHEVSHKVNKNVAVHHVGSQYDHSRPDVIGQKSDQEGQLRMWD